MSDNNVSACSEYVTQPYKEGALLRVTRTIPTGVGLSKTPVSPPGSAGVATLRVNEIVEVVREIFNNPYTVWWPAKNAYIRGVAWAWFEPV
jgi:hypothetical protein